MLGFSGLRTVRIVRVSRLAAWRLWMLVWVAEGHGEGAFFDGNMW